MPFTPFHMGPGAAIKAVTGRYFSLTVFGLAQVLIDLEPLIRMLRHDSILHGYTHTYAGALLMALPALFAGKIVCERLLTAWNVLFDYRYLKWLQVDATISWTAATTGAFLGTFSHVLLDSLMHADMRPFWPFSAANALLGLIPASAVYLFCIGLGVFGLIGIVVIGVWKRWQLE